MNRVNSNNCFYKNGKKILKKKISNLKDREEISSLSSIFVDENKFSIAGTPVDKTNVKNDVFFKVKRNPKNTFKR